MSPLVAMLLNQAEIDHRLQQLNPKSPSWVEKSSQPKRESETRFADCIRSSLSGRRACFRPGLIGEAGGYEKHAPADWDQTFPDLFVSTTSSHAHWHKHHGMHAVLPASVEDDLMRKISPKPTASVIQREFTCVTGGMPRAACSDRTADLMILRLRCIGRVEAALLEAGIDEWNPTLRTAPRPVGCVAGTRSPDLASKDASAYVRVVAPSWGL